MSLLQLSYVIAVRRIISTWRLETVLFLGILLAVALMSSGVVYSDLLAEASLRRALDRASPEEANVTVRVFGGLVDPSRASAGASFPRRSQEFVDERVWPRFQPYFGDRATLFETFTFFFQGRPQLELPDEVRPRGKISNMTGLLPDRIEVVQGRWPYSAGTSPSDPGDALEVALPARGAELLQLGLNDEYEVLPAGGVYGDSSMKVRVVGLFTRTDPADEFWYGAQSRFSYERESWTMVPLFTTEEAILGRVSRAYPGLQTDLVWFFYLDRRGVGAGDVDSLQQAMLVVGQDVRTNLERSGMAVGLDDVLDDYEEQLLLARVPLYLMIFLVAGILVYYLVVVTGLVVKSRTAEISMVKSRGATTLQIGLLALVEGVFLAVPAVALGPVLALGVSRVLGSAFFGSDVVAGDLTPALHADAFFLGAAGAVLAVAVLTVSTLAAARQGVVEASRGVARPEKVPFIHRYYIDIALLALIGLIWWQIQSRGSLLVRSVGTGELEIDYSLLIGPVLGLLALGLLVMRVFPWAMMLLARLVEPLGPPWLVQGLRHVSRSPMVPGTLVVLLILATALGVIGSAFSSTLERSQEERALYAAGADLRVRQGGDGTPRPIGGLSAFAEGIDGIRGAAEVNRTGGSRMTGGFSTSTVSVLAVDTDRFGDVAWYRSDFAGGKSLDRLMEALDAKDVAETDGIRLPDDATGLALWVNQARPTPNLSVLARLRDSRGLYFDAAIGGLGFTGWRRLEGAISPIPPRRFGRSRAQPPEVKPPFTLLALHSTLVRGIVQPGALFLDDLSVVSGEGEEVLADFETLEGWHAIEDYSSPGTFVLESSESVVRPGGGRSAAFTWTAGGSGGLRGIRAGPPEGPIPAVVSNSLLEEADISVGDTLSMWLSLVPLPIRVVKAADFFPTIQSRSRPFVVVDLATLNHYINVHARNVVVGGNELWMDLGGRGWNPGTVLAALEDRGVDVNEAHVASEMISDRVDQPLVNAGWGGLLVLTFLALLLASGSGVMLFSYVDARERQTEFVLLRTLGFSRGQLYAVAWFNLLLVAACGIGLGTWVGHQIGASLLPMLEVAEEGVLVTPPMVLRTNWGALLVSYLALAGVTAVAALWLAWLTARLDLQRVLRMGEA